MKIIKKYLDTRTNSQIVVWPWDSNMKEEIKKNQDRYLELYEE